MSEIINKTERVRRSKESEFSEILAIIAKFTDWALMEKIKNGLIKSKSSIYVSQMYSPSTYEMKKQRDYSKKRAKTFESIQISAFVKYPAKLMVRKTGEKEYRVHGEY